jgi:hypothetical protein
MHRPAHVNHGNTEDGGQRRARWSSLARTASRAQPAAPSAQAAPPPSAPREHLPAHPSSLLAARTAPPQRAGAPQRSPHRPSSARWSTPAQPAPPLLSADVEPTCVSREVKHTCAQHRRVVGVSRSVSALPAVPRQLLHGRHHRGDLGAAPFWLPTSHGPNRAVGAIGDGLRPTWCRASRSSWRSGRSGMGSGPLGAAHRGPPGGRGDRGWAQAHLVLRMAVLLAVGAVGKVGDGLRPTWCCAWRSSWRSGKASDDGLLGRQMAGGAVRRLTSHRRSPL